MKRRYLSLLLPACVAALAPALVDASGTGAPGLGSADPATSSVILLSVADIPATLASTQGHPTGWRSPASLNQLSPRDAAARGMPVAAWVTSVSLGDEAVQARVRSLLEEGAAILVTSGPGEARRELATFGFEATGRTAIYRQTDDGLSVTSVIAGIADPGAPSMWQEASDATAAAMISSNVPHLEALSSDDALHDETQGDRAFLRVSNQVIASHGRSASQVIRVMRDTTASHDFKVIAVEATVNVIPYANGVSKPFVDDDGETRQRYERDGEGFFLFAANAYRSTTVLQWQGDSPSAQLMAVAPKTSGTTNRKISEEIASKSTLTASIAPDYARGLNKDGIFYQGKVPFSLAWASETSERSVVEMTVEDYSVSATAKTYPWGLASTWTFPLASDIGGNPDYFGKEKLSTKKMTPMMREASLATASEWRVDGNYEKTILVASRGTVENRRFTWSGVRDDPKAGASVFHDRASIDAFDPSEKGLPWEMDTNDASVGDAQPWVVSKIDLSSPYLTRSPTILIQSLAGLGECLQADNGKVELAPCDKGKRSQQWNLEADSTYRNRANGACLTAAPGDGDVTTKACEAHALNQQWKWSADRIHSMYDGGETWRLHVRERMLNAKFDPSRHQRMAANPNHFLLRPWSSYPSAPSEKDWVPTLSGRQPDFQKLPGYEYREVETSERWQTIALRHGL
ncbi:hemolysin [Luteibacter sp. HA06]